MLYLLFSGWVQKRLMKIYIDCCKELSEPPNLKLLKKLYNLEVGFIGLICLLVMQQYPLAIYSLNSCRKGY